MPAGIDQVLWPATKGVVEYLNRTLAIFAELSDLLPDEDRKECEKEVSALCGKVRTLLRELGTTQARVERCILEEALRDKG